MKIAIVTPGRSHLINLARELDSQPECDVVFYTMMPKGRCRKFGYYGKVTSCFFPVGVLFVLIERIPFLNPYNRSYLRIRLRLFFDLYVSWQMKKCDVLIGLNGAAVKASIKAKKRFNTITICDQGSSHILKQDSVRRSYTTHEPPRINTEYMLQHYAAVDYLMTAASYVKDSDTENGIPSDRILYNPYGVNLEVFRPTLKPSNDACDVIMVGSWWKHKGCDMLAEACINRLGVKLLHVGSVIDCELPDSPLFKHIDFVAESDLPKYYAQAKVFAMPSLDEGFGLVLLQAAACGLPIVGSARTGTSDVGNLLGSPTGCVTIEEPLSVETIACAIQKALFYAESLPEGYRVQCKNEIQNISWEAYGKRYYEILKKLIIQ